MKAIYEGAGMMQLTIEFNACPYCGEELLVDVLDYWHDDGTGKATWLFETCCEGSHTEAVAFSQEDPRGFGRWFSERTGEPVRRSYGRDGQMRVDFGLRLEAVTLAEAKAFVDQHHRHNKPPCGWRWGHAVYNGRKLVAVAMVGRPVARALDHTKVVEVNRLCVDPTLDPELVWNACSMSYSAAAKTAKRRGFERIITYTLESEGGVALRASGWTATTTTKGGSWSTPSRPRKDKASTCRKVRWERGLTKRWRRALQVIADEEVAELEALVAEETGDVTAK